ncbi:putative bifunctional diguanylate cyclase/phosphodiesterase [Baekduia alba]|uniref:putative bifunctional diguanylate cyclase/phosphodiesterase n=1 Tax=Baekduia alba TaxID=2997333 RepID=UPI002342634B|nr:GGDEF domain-containing phosphodiesterase [Baekduia alba]
MDPVRTPEHDPGTLHEAEARFRIAFEEAGVSMAIVGLDGSFLRVNRALSELLGHPVEALLAGGMALVHHADGGPTSDNWRRLTIGEIERYQFDRPYRHANGDMIWGNTTMALVRGDDGQPLYAIGQLQDITARKQAEDRADRRAKQQTALARLSQLALTEQDFSALAHATVRSITASLDVSLAGLAADDGDHAPLRHLSGSHSDDPGESVAARLDEQHARYTLALRNPVVVRDAATEERFDVSDLRGRGLASGMTVAVAGEGDAPFGVLGMYATSPRAFDDDDLAFLQSVANVLTGALRRLSAERGLRHQALHDPLTQLPNRMLLLDRLRLSLARRRREGRYVAVLYLDVDDFKGINDSLGHAAGDALLRALAPRLSEVLRPSDTLARLGGDEFAILLEGLDDPAESVRVAERLLSVIGAPVDVAGVSLRSTASIGIALAAPDAPMEGEDLVRDAGVAMYRAKRAGRGRAELFDDAMRAETVERLALTNDLRQAVEDGDLRLVYQPLVHLGRRQASGFEALIRWTHPERGEIPPGRFIPLAEQHGLIEPLGQWVMREALTQLRRWQDAGFALDMGMSVNVSRVQLSRPGLADDIFALLDELALAADRLVVEVTESAVMEDPDVATATLDALAERGVRIALDDFGVGQSSLACLRDLPLDALKLDRQFITSLASSREAAAIVRAVCDMARTLHFGVVAEGVETEAQWQVVEALGCDFGQGFLYARPTRPEDIPATVAEVDARLGGGVSVGVVPTRAAA